MAPVAEMVRFPAPRFKACIPLASPVTAFAVIVMKVPFVVELVAIIPCLPAPVPITDALALILIEPVLILSAKMP